MAEQPVNVTRDDEIDLFDLVDDIKNKWIWVVGSTLTFLLLAIFYCAKSEPLYQVDTVLKHVEPKELAQINQPEFANIPGHTITPSGAFNRIRSLLVSSSVMGSYYQSLLEEADLKLHALIYDESLSEEQNEADFAERFDIEAAVRNGEEEVVVQSLYITFDLEDAELAAEVLNRYIAFVVMEYTKETKETLEYQTELQMSKWNLEIEKLRTLYTINKERRITNLKEAINIASAIGQKKPVYSAETVNVGTTPPQFMLGETTLRTELQDILNRKSINEDQYISGLSELLYTMNLSERVDIDWSKVKFIEVDKRAIIPRQPIKPRKSLIIALGIVGGIMFGILAALIAAASDRRFRRSERH